MSNALKDLDPSRSHSRATEVGAERISAYYLELQGLLDRIEHAATHYQVLGLKRSATKEEIHLAYRQAVTLLHPGQYGINLSLPDDMMARTKQAFDGVSTALAVLTNLGKRIEYDNSLRSKTRVPLPIGISEPAQQSGPRARAETGHNGQSLHPPMAQDQDQGGSINDEAQGETIHKEGQEVIVINHLPAQQAIYSKLADSATDEDRRRCPRFNLAIPAYVTIYDRAGRKAQEIAQVINVGRFGIGIRLSKPVEPGRVLHLSLPMPIRLRSHGFADFRYGVYAIVRWAGPPQNGTNLVGLEFIGEHPPVGFLDKPWATFEIRRNKKLSLSEKREEQP